MSGQISLLNAINKKEAQANSVERQSLPKSTNAFALLMAKSHADHQDSNVKTTSKTVLNQTDKMSSKQDSEKADSQNSDGKDIKEPGKQKAIDDVLPQLSIKDTPLKVSKESDASSGVTDKAAENPISTDLVVPNATDSTNVAVPDTTSASNVAVSNADGADVNPQATGLNPSVSSAGNTASDMNKESDLAAATANGNSDMAAPNTGSTTATITNDGTTKTLGKDGLEKPTVAQASSTSAEITQTPGQTGTTSTEIQPGVVTNNAQTGKPETTGNNPTDSSSVDPKAEVVAEQASPDAQQNSDSTTVNNVSANSQNTNTGNNVVVNKAQSDMASQYSGNRTVASSSVAPNSTSTATTSTSTGVDTSGSSSQAGQQNSGQQGFSQNGQGNPSSPNSFMNQVIQSQQAAIQQAAVKQFNDMSMASGTTNPDTSKLLGNLGLDTKGQLPPSLQGIAYSLRSPQWSQALGQRVVYMASNKVQEAKITLNPEKLGPVQIKLHMDKNQQLHISMSAHHHMTKETMEAAVPKLKEMLDSTGIDLGSIDVNQDNQFDAPQQNNEQGQEKGGAFGKSLAVEETDQDIQPVVVKQTDSLIDYYA